MHFDIPKFRYLPVLVLQDGIQIQSVEHPMDLMFSLRRDHLQAGNKSSQQNHEHFIISRTISYGAPLGKGYSVTDRLWTIYHRFSISLTVTISMLEIYSGANGLN